MDQEQRPSYYAVIPADVRYDDRLPANAKLLYGEITALANAKGFCYASNDYFCQLYGFSERTISRLFGALESSGYIRREVERDKNGTVTSRKIWISVSAACTHPVDNFVTPSRHFCQDPPDKNVRENNTGEYIIPPVSPENAEPETAGKKGRPRKTSTKLTDEQLRQQVQQNVAALGDANGWTRDEKNSVYKLVLEFYSDRECNGSPPKHTVRGINGLFRNLAKNGSCTGQQAADMLLEAIERGWTSVYPRDGKGKAPAVPPRTASAVEVEEW